MSQKQFDALPEVKNDELYAVNVDDKFVTTDTAQVVTASKQFNQPIIGLGGMNVVQNSIQKGEIPSSTLYSGIRFNDKTNTSPWQNTRLGVIEHTVEKDSGNTRLFLGTYRNASGSEANSYLNIICPLNANPYVLAPASKMNNSVLTTAVSSFTGNGYVKLGNGLIIQWGSNSTNNVQTGTITFPTAFTSTVAITYTPRGVSNQDSNYKRGITNKTVTNFTWVDWLGNKASQIDWIAIGY